MLSLPIIIAHWNDSTPKRCRDILAHASSWEDIQHINTETLQKAQWQEKAIMSFFAWKRIANPEQMEEQLQKHGIHTITAEDPQYPTLLLPLSDKPLVLFVRGILQTCEHMLAVVGTRACTRYGYQALETILPPLAGQPLGIVSGMALGIDGKAHETALENQFYTIAVLGCGIDDPTIYPRAHMGLSKRILDSGGALVGEYPPGYRPTAYSFPARNRIIAGLSHATLVVEGTYDSGSLLTAKAALEYGRDVAAIPHPINTPTGIGPNTLLHDGAAFIRSHEDIQTLFSLPAIKKKVERDTSTLSAEEQKIYTVLLKHGTLHIDDITRHTSLPTHTALSILTMLELQQYVKSVGMMEFSIA